jgi:hypothetical protein
MDYFFTNKRNLAWALKFPIFIFSWTVVDFPRKGNIYIFKIMWEFTKFYFLFNRNYYEVPAPAKMIKYM